jgi:uncharacterized protein YllA (UPF0747 family)
MRELGLEWPDLLRDEAELMKKIVQSEFLDRCLESLNHLQSTRSESLDRLTSLAASHSKGLLDPLNKQFGMVEKTLSQVEDLLRRDEMKRQEDLRQRIISLKQSLVPEGGLQERVYGILPFIARYGREWIEALVDSAKGWNGESHYVYRLGGSPE